MKTAKRLSSFFIEQTLPTISLFDDRIAQEISLEGTTALPMVYLLPIFSFTDVLVARATPFLGSTQVWDCFSGVFIG